MSTNKSFLFNVGSALGKGAAYTVHGTRLGATHLAQGAAEGYASKAAELKAKRLALAREMAAEPAAEPAVAKPRRALVKA